MPDELLIQHSITKIAKSSLIIFITLGIAYALALIARIILANYLGPDDFGIFTLGLTIIGLLGIFSTFSLPVGVTRNISFHYHKRNVEQIRGIILSALTLTFIFSIFTTIITILISQYISNFYNQQKLNEILLLLAISIPFTAILTILGSIFQGFEQTKENAVFKNLVPNILRILSYLTVIYLSYGLIGITLAYTLAIIIPALAFCVFFITKIPKIIHWTWKGTKEYGLLLKFSTPLFIANYIWNISSQIILLLIGYYYSPNEIGIFTTAILFPSIFVFIIESTNFLYLPIFSTLFSKNQFYEMNRTFQIITKWLILLGIPLVTLFIIYPNQLINSIFETSYSSGANVLIIMTLGSFFSLIQSTSQGSLIAMGKTRLCMYFSSIATLLGIILGILLIPLYGINGAAIALTIQYFTAMSLYLGSYYSTQKIHPFSKQLIKPLPFFILLSIILYVITSEINLKLTIIHLILIFLFYIMILSLSVIIFGGFEKSDIDIIIKIEKKMGLNLGILKKLVKKIIHIDK